MLNKNDAGARVYWAEYDKIPKSVFALIAWHLANRCSGVADEPMAAENVFYEEWKILIEAGFTIPARKFPIPSTGAIK